MHYKPMIYFAFALCIVTVYSMDVQSDEIVSTTKPILINDALVRLIAEVYVPATESGQLTEVLATEGQLLQKGAPIGRLNDELVKIDAYLAGIEKEIAQEKSSNDVDRRFAEKSLEVAESELRLSRDAVRRVPDSISQTELDRLRLVVEKSSLSIEQAERDMRIAKLNQQLDKREYEAAVVRVARRQILAPIDGQVAEVLAQPGEWLNPGDPIVKIIRMDRLRIEVTLDGQKYGPELQGREVEFEVALPPGDRIEKFQGLVTYVSPEVQPINGTIRVWAEVENPDRLLRPGVHGKLTIRPRYHEK
ncbi:efflux RND transporter periplasmic adaptor subunit [Rubinisphaera italica]|uniref:Biotin-requiring enzyme n=1 Tax=Rubinisphaera italica TaxID=2527969 RepID=A0A5C5X9F3_9PLAN|nr:HlyD family efflux transporter periplasmic adaptor subunit [Rubinisphaera italica]TWT59777.1 Biotin-requiring enzyme [Rubinisphaera italica]